MCNTLLRGNTVLNKCTIRQETDNKCISVVAKFLPHTIKKQYWTLGTHPIGKTLIKLFSTLSTGSMKVERRIPKNCFPRSVS